MVDTPESTSTIEERSDAGQGDEGLWRYWDMQEAIAEREEREWRREAKKIQKRYRDERSDANKKRHRFNILWSNVQTLKPAIYGRPPKADCERRFKDQDDTGRLAAEILERGLDYSLEGFDDAMKPAVEDRLLPGRGTIRVLYVPHYGEPLSTEGAEGDEERSASQIAGEGDEDEAPAAQGSGARPVSQAAEPNADAQPAEAPLREVIWEEVQLRYVSWHDYREGPARQWSEVPWVRYQAYMTRDELRQRFGKAKADKVTLDFTPKGTAEREDTTPPDAFKKAIVREYWDKAKKEAVWLAPGTPDVILDRLPDPLKLKGFFPNPNPLLATTTTDRRVPVPDYHQYADQADQLDTLSARIQRLEKALKVSGVYPGEEKATLQQLVDDTAENKLIPVDDWGAFADKGGLPGMISWLPIKEIAETLIRLYEARDKAKQILYEITGIGDIMRGATSPDETYGAQRLKSQYGTLRLSDSQKDVARLSRDLIRLMADIIATHFSPRTISMMTGYPQLLPMPPMPQPPAVPPELLMGAPPQTGLGAPPAPAAGPTSPAPGAPAAPDSALRQPQGLAPPQPGQPPQAPAPPSPAVQAYLQARALYNQQLQAFQAAAAENQKRQAQFDAAVRLIKEDVLEGFKIDIEADSTIAIDENAEKQARTEFLEQMIPLLEQVIPIAQGNPPMAKLAREITLFAVRSFKVGRTLEESFEEAFDAIAKMPPKPDPKAGKSPAGEIAEAEARMHDTNTQAAVDMHETQSKAEIAAQANALKMRQIEGQLRLGQQRQEAEDMRSAAELAMAHEAHQSEEALRAARISSIAARGAQGLT